MIIRVENSFEKILDIHPLIFDNPFPMASYQKKAHDYGVVPFGFYEEDKLVGYCLVIEQHIEKTMRPWVGGVLPAVRNKGYFSSFYIYLIDYARERGYLFIEANTDNYKPSMIRMLVKIGFDIIAVDKTEYGDGRKIKFRYTIQPPLCLRLSITSRCNLNCFFCHHEGIRPAKSHVPSLPEIERLLIQAKKQGTTEITVTGGEPFVCPETIGFILDYCSGWCRPPRIKIVTNGQLVNERITRKIGSYPGNAFVHLSLHSLDEDTARSICGAGYSIEKTVETISLLNQYRVLYRINCTALSGLNDSVNCIRRILDFGIANHAESVHFMELLVTNDQPSLFKYYCEYDAFKSTLMLALSGYEVVDCDESAKKILFKIKDSCSHDFSVSVYRLSCRIGCQNCRAENDVTIGSDFNCYPCYLMPEKTCGNALESLSQSILNRNLFLREQDDTYAQKRLFWGSSD